MELNGRVIAANVEIHARLFDVSLAPRLDRVLESNLAGVAAPDVYIAYAEPDMQVSAGDEVTGIGMRLLISPIICRADWNE